MSARVKLTEEQLRINRAKTQRAYYKKNKKAAKAYNKSRYQEQKTPIVVVYQIEDYDGKGNNYCGITQNLYNRMCKHKSLGKMNVDDWSVLSIAMTREEARELERGYHQSGYHGAYQRDDCDLKRDLEKDFKTNN